MMNILEKILEEMENESRLAHEEMRRCARGNPLQFDEVKGYARAMEYVVGTIRSHVDEVNNNGWIPVSERLPEEDDLRFYMCVLENHEEDLPMFCQYNEMYGFGFWSDIYDPISLGFVDTEFSSMDELGYEKVVAWRPLPEPYRTTEE